MIQRSYEMAVNPPPPSPWTEYSAIAANELSEALAADAAESDIHALFERHPCLIPGRHGIPISSANAPMRSQSIP